MEKKIVTILFCDRAIVTIYGTIVTILSLIVTNSHYLGPIGLAVGKIDFNYMCMNDGSARASSQQQGGGGSKLSARGRVYAILTLINRKFCLLLVKETQSQPGYKKGCSIAIAAEKSVQLAHLLL